jgi:hypothetical protein
MSVGQPIAPGSVSTAPTPKIKIEHSSSTAPILPNPVNLTIMLWALHTGGVVNSYNDLAGISDHGDVIGMTLKFPGTGSLIFSIGDNLNDWDSNVVIPDDTWHHFCFTTTPWNGAATRPALGRGYVDGIEVVNSLSGVGYMTAPDRTNTAAPPAGPAFISLFNTRASDNPGDATAVFQGNMCAVKIWTDTALTPEEIRREMWAFTPQRTTGLWAFSPLTNINTASHNYAGLANSNWTVQGTDLTTGSNSPAGVVWDYPAARRDPTSFFTGAVAFTGLEQLRYRFRFDDGTESTATAIYGADNPITAPVSTNRRLRVLLNAASVDPASTQYKLEYRKNGGAWTGVATAQPTTSVPTFGAATELSNAAGISGLPIPAGSIGDLLLLLVNTANEAISVTTSGWTQVTNSPQSTGTAAAAGGVRLGVYWRIRDGTEPTVTIADSGSYTYAKVIRLSGVDTSAPINITAGSVDSAATTNLTAPGVTTTVANCLIVHIVGLDKDANDIDTFTGTAANANLTSITEQFDNTVSTGAGGGLLIITGAKATAGATGNTTATAGFDTSTTHAYITIAGAPTPVTLEPLLVSLSGNFAPGATTAQFEPPSGKATTDFVAGRIEEAANPATAVDITSDDYTELEWCLQAVSGTASVNDVFEFRVTANGTPIDAYDVTPQWTISSTANLKSRPHYPKGLRIHRKRRVI